MKRYITHLLPPLVALITVLGIAVHDTKIDTMTKIAIALPAMMASFEGAHTLLHAGEAHTHVEKVSVSETAGRFTVRTPSLFARQFEDKKYVNNSKIRGHHPFDDCLLPA